MAASVLAFQNLSKYYFQELFILAGSVILGVIVYIVLGLLFQKELISELKILLTKGYTAG